ncbi:hypothetical protein MP228_011409 [Amoeboaphelidium protococcarum]|nr:hypothetical protein MP228_011409 [Amoeboaphelidium protococcarum]
MFVDPDKCTSSRNALYKTAQDQVQNKKRYSIFRKFVKDSDQVIDMEKWRRRLIVNKLKSSSSWLYKNRPPSPSDALLKLLSESSDQIQSLIRLWTLFHHEMSLTLSLNFSPCPRLMDNPMIYNQSLSRQLKSQSVSHQLPLQVDEPDFDVKKAQFILKAVQSIRPTHVSKVFQGWTHCLLHAKA